MPRVNQLRLHKHKARLHSTTPTYTLNVLSANSTTTSVAVVYTLIKSSGEKETATYEWPHGT